MIQYVSAMLEDPEHCKPNKIDKQNAEDSATVSELDPPPPSPPDESFETPTIETFWSRFLETPESRNMSFKCLADIEGPQIGSSYSDNEQTRVDSEQVRQQKLL